MLEEVTVSEWGNFVKNNCDDSIFCDPFFLNVFARHFNFTVNYHIWKDNGICVLGFGFFSTANRVKSPVSVIGFHVVEKLAQEHSILANHFCNALDAFKRKYKSIHLQLPVDFKYNNELKNNGFNMSLKKTFEKDLSSLTYSRNINRTLRKDEGYACKLSTNFEQSFEIIWRSNQFFFPHLDKNSFLAVFKDLNQIQIVDMVDIEKHGKHVGAISIIKDYSSRKYYTYLISMPDKNIYPEAQTLLYDFCMRYYKSLGYEICDFVGANIPAVANYKARFKPTLKTYFYAEYYNSVFEKVRVLVRRKIGAIAINLISKLSFSK